jgi:mxaL protein
MSDVPAPSASAAPPSSTGTDTRGTFARTSSSTGTDASGTFARPPSSTGTDASGTFARNSLSLWLALVLFLIALFAPSVNLPRTTYDYIVFFDITQSMDVQDYELGGSPVSRLEYARYAMRRALHELPCGSRIGWGAFAEYRSLLLLAPVEVCSNYNDLLTSLNNIDGRMRWANASEVGKGVYWSVRAALEDSVAIDKGAKPDVLFISDGHEAPPLNPTEPVVLPDDVQPGQVHGWILGAGGETPQRIPRTDADGHHLGYWNANDVIQLVAPDGRHIIGAEQLSAVREPHLKALAARVGFAYTRLTGPDSISAAMRDTRYARRAPAPVDLYWLPVAAALLLLAVRFSPRRFR